MVESAFIIFIFKIENIKYKWVHSNLITTNTMYYNLSLKRIYQSVGLGMIFIVLVAILLQLFVGNNYDIIILRIGTIVTIMTALALVLLLVLLFNTDGKGKEYLYICGIIMCILIMIHCIGLVVARYVVNFVCKFIMANDNNIIFYHNNNHNHNHNHNLILLIN